MDTEPELKMNNLEMLQGRETPWSTLQQWCKLFACIILIWLFVFVLAPGLQHYKSIQKIHTFIESRNIEATGLVYTEVDEFSDADIYMRNVMKY